MATIFTDNFVGTVNTPLNGRVASGGGTWQCFGIGAADIAGMKINATNQAKVATANGCLARAETGTADHYAKAAIQTLTTAGAVAVRAADHLNFIGLRVANATNVELFKRIAGVETSIVKVSVATLATPVTLQLMCVGTTATLFVNGAQVGTVTGYTVADAVFAGVTKTGLWGKASALDPLAASFEGGTAVTTLATARGHSGLTDRNVALTPTKPATVTIAAARGRSASTDRGTGIAAGFTFALAPARARSGLTDRGTAVAASIALGPAASRLAQIARQGGVAEAFALAPVGARSLARDRGAALIVGAAAIAPAGARQGLTNRGSGAAWTGAVIPAASRLAQRAGLGGLGLVLGVAAAGGRLAQRAGTPGLTEFNRIAPDGGRLAGRAGAGAATPFAMGTITRVQAEVRTTAVGHD